MFCKSEVELMEREADHPQISALAMIMRVGLEVQYLGKEPQHSQLDRHYEEQLEQALSDTLSFIFLFFPFVRSLSRRNLQYNSVL